MAPTGSACHASVRWVITPLAASPASFQPSNAAMMTGAVSLPIPLSSISHHPFLAARWRCRFQPTCSPMIACYPAGPVRHGADDARRLDWGPYDEERPQGPEPAYGGQGAGGVAPR